MPASHALESGDMPNLFIVGAQKSGTSSLHATLARHPDIFMCEPKEPAYFIPKAERPVDIYGGAADEMTERQAYLALFRRGAAARYRGESSTHYSMAPRFTSAANAIYRACPGARIIYLMRDPVERTISHYWWNCQHYDETRPPLQAIRENPDYCNVSYYAMQLRPYLELFPQSNICVLTTELYAAQPDVELQRLLTWLQVDPTISLGEARRENVTPAVIGRQRFAPLAALRSPGFSMSVKKWLPRGLHQLAKNVRSFVLQFNERPVARSEVAFNDVIEYLRPIQLRQTDELAELLGRCFPEWRTLAGATRQAAMRQAA